MIYVNGDSFTAGTGLSDYEFIPDFEKYNKHNISMPDYYQVRKKIVDQSREVYDAYHTRNKELSWPAQLGKILGTEVFNAGEGGSSMSSIGYRTLIDLTKLQMKGIIPERVIIMVTDENRITLIQTQHIISDVIDTKLNWIESHLLNNIAQKSTYGKSFIKETILVQSTTDLIIKWSLEIAMLKNIVKGLTGKYPIFAAPAFITRSIKQQLMNQNLLDVASFSELFIAINDILDMDPMLLLNPVGTIPDGHFDKISHEVFAQQVAKYIQTLTNKEKIYE
jgi:hypothetical protein